MSTCLDGSVQARYGHITAGMVARPPEGLTGLWVCAGRPAAPLSGLTGGGPLIACSGKRERSDRARSSLRFLPDGPGGSERLGLREWKTGPDLLLRGRGGRI